LSNRDDLDLEDEDKVNETNQSNGTSQNIEPVNACTILGIVKRKEVMARALAFRERECEDPFFLMGLTRARPDNTAQVVFSLTLPLYLEGRDPSLLSR
jgi:hypothetical protein